MPLTLALSPRTSPASAIFRIRVLPSDAQMESLIRPLHKTKMPRGTWPSTNSTAPLGYSMRYLIVSKVCNAAPERSQKICSARVLQLRQLSMMSNPYGVSTTAPRFSSFSCPHYPNTSCHMQQVLRSPGVVTWTFLKGTFADIRIDVLKNGLGAILRTSHELVTQQLGLLKLLSGFAQSQPFETASLDTG